MSVKQLEVKWGIKEMPSPFPCNPVINEWLWKKKKKKTDTKKTPLDWKTEVESSNLEQVVIFWLINKNLV